MSIFIPLSNIDIQEKISCKFITYNKMPTISNIDMLLPKTLILYQLADVGHFTCVFENDEGINFFDPLGYTPDYMLSKVSKNYNPLNHDYTYLIDLLIKQNKPVIYNEHKLQKMNTATCGHWCTVRMRYNNLHCDEFAECFKGLKNRDKTIVKIYNNIYI